MTPTLQTFRCERFGEVRIFSSYAEAYRFVMREGDKSRLWTLAAV